MWEMGFHQSFELNIRAKTLLIFSTAWHLEKAEVRVKSCGK